MKHTAMITCASVGLGMEFASQIAAQGIDVVLVARREARLHEPSGQLREAHGVRVECVVADLADPDAARYITERVDYDGVNKWRTKIGVGATIGAGSTITKDAPDDKLTLERGKQLRLEGWKRPVKQPKG
jgi:NAD(P)-dependent dehydrogenase (short-subunit alcohol dehydrogenase family)